MTLSSGVEEIVVEHGVSNQPSKTIDLDGVAGTSAPLQRGPHELIEDQVERTPDAPALTLGPERISYRELNSRANRLAHFLCERGVAPEGLVGVYLDRSLASVVSLLAILKSGGTYLPLDAKFPRDRVAFMLADSEVPLLLTHSSKRESLPKTAAQVIQLDLEGESLSKARATNLASTSNAEHLAYLIYTSGSTGKPKGVMIPRRALVNFLWSMAKKPGIAASDRLLAVTTSSFDISLLEFLLPLVCGAEIVLATAEQAAEVRQLRTLLRQHEVTVMQATPATWRMLLENGWEGKSDLRVFCGGEALTADLTCQLLPRCRELWNMYGPTETTIWSSTDHVISADQISLGTPIANTQFHVLDESQKTVPPGTPGELWIGGKGLAHGYLKRPELTAERFVLKPGDEGANARFYRTGDQVRYRPDGSLEFLGRLDEQVKLNGFRIELGEIESALGNIDGITRAVVILREDRPGDKRLAAYYTGREGLSSTFLIQSLKSTLPDYMVPSVFVRLKKLPLTPNAKLDRKALPRPQAKRPLLAQDFIAPRTVAEKQLTSLWCELLQLEEVGIDDSFFDLGGNSLAAVRMVSEYQTRFGREIPPVKVFQHPTIAKLAEFLEDNESKPDVVVEAENRARHRRKPKPDSERKPSIDTIPRDAVAVIGMTGRFPGAANLDQLWRNLCNAVESISFFTPDELGPGIDLNVRDDPDYVRARGLIEGADLFDAAFFGISPLEAKVMDPQQRVFLELAQEALEKAGYDPERYMGRIGVFAGIGDNHYYTTNLLTQPDLLAMAGKLAVEYGNQKDYIALRTAYLLDLRGPAVSINTACSTTLLTIDEAYHSLLDYECDMALSGGVDITVPQKSGFLYQVGGTFTKDGHCRPFDADATGTMFCDGAGVVVLKRFADALADGDTIYAVICGTGKSNNGARPASFLAPSVDGQAEAIALAQANADVPVETIGYIEAHGTGTPVGDPIEFEALRRVFESKTDRKHFCYLGSIKGNIGHPTNAAGVAGLIKAALVLDREQIPPTLHFKTANPKIDFASSPFLMADKLIPFPRGEQVRRAAVSSFGFGGTNVHVILEEAPVAKNGRPSRPLQLLPISAKSLQALDVYSRALADHLASATPEDLADAAYTFQTGRKQMVHRRFVVAADSAEAAKLLVEPNPLRYSSKRCERRDPPIVFLFGGQGTQYVNMGLNLYRDEPLFRAVVDDCCERLKPHLGRDLRELLYPQSGDEQTAQISLRDTFFTQPSIFVIEYALARFWQSLGIKPATMAGHSIGEFVAATLAGVWDLEDVLSVVALRGRLMQDLPRGSMMAVSSSAESVVKILPPALQLATNNAPALCVVSGPEADIVEFGKQLEADNLVCRQLHTSHAFHSAMMEPMIEPLRQAVAKIKLRAPAKPFVSTVTGRPITAAETTNPAYWASHARATVEFSKAVRSLKDQGHDLFLECGPRSTMCALARQHFTPDHPCTAIPTFADTPENNTEWATLLFALGSLWQNGVSIDWDGFYTNEERRRIPLPTYPFERQRFWVEPAVVAPAAQNAGPASSVAPVRSRVEPPVESSNVLLARPTVPAETLSAGSPPASRKDRIVSRVVDLLMPVSGRKRSQIDASATFMEQGFDSLSLTQVAFAIQKEFSVKVSFSQLMKQWPNIDMLAAHLDSTLPVEVLAQAVAAPTANSPAGVPTNVQPDLRTRGSVLEEVVAEQARTIARLVALLENGGADRPVSNDNAAALVASQPSQDAPKPAAVAPSGPRKVEATVPQRGIFSSSRLCDRLSASYNESVTLRFTGSISVEKMSRAVESLVERHDALRASFDETGMTMKIAPTLKIPLPVVDLSAIEAQANGLTAQEECLRELIAEEAALPFPLPIGPLFRCQMVLLGRERAAVIMTAHHIICDGWSLDVLTHDLCAFYSEEVSGASARLEPAKSYADYVQSVTERQRSEEFKQAGRYWHLKFNDGFPLLVLPTDHPRSVRREFRACRLDHPVSPAKVHGLRAVGVKHGCSFFAALVSSLAILLARISRQRRFVIALPSAEQPSIGQPGLAGHCVNLLPFVVELREGEAADAFLRRVQTDLLAAHEHAMFTMASLLEDVHPVAPALGVSPISVGLTNVKKFKPDELSQSGFAVAYEVNPKAYESCELYLNAVEMEEILELRCHYDTQLFGDLTIRRWLTALESIIEELAGDPSREVVGLAGLADRQGSNLGTTGEKVSSALGPMEPLTSFADSRATSMTAEPRMLESLLPLWQRVLDVRKVEPDDDFFALGGHSVAAAQLFALIQSELRCNAPLATLYDAPTPRMLARALGRGAKAEGGPGLVLERNDPAVRPFVVDDIPQVADLWWRFLRYSKGAAPPAAQSYLQELYFQSPLSDKAMPSLVYEGKNGRIVGFLGVIRRRMSLHGRPIRVAFGGNFVVDSEARSSMAAVGLLSAYMAGGQDISLTDSANDISKNLQERLGFRTITAMSIHWARPLRMTNYAVHAMSKLAGPVLSASLRIVARPFCSVVDSIGAKLAFSTLSPIRSQLHAAELDIETLIRCLDEFRGDHSLSPDYDVDSLQWLLTFMERMHPRADLRKVVLCGEDEKIVGWYIYYLKPGDVGQVVQIGGEKQFVKGILDHLFYDAWSRGAIGLHGVAPSYLMDDFSERQCFFVCGRGGWTIAHARNPELIEILNRGDASLSRLDGEWCLNFDK